MTEGPMQAAQRLMRPELPRRFYRSAAAAPCEDGFTVLLDGRPVRTPGKARVAVPRLALAEALAAEWNAQGERIDPSRMPLTRIVNSAIDAVSREMDAVRAEIVKYAGSDLLCYRADGPDRLVERQKAAWDPVVEWAEAAFGARFVLAEGVVFAAQPESSLRAVAGPLEELDMFRLAAANVITTLTGSALLALAVLRGRLRTEEAWALAHIDEDWNIEIWGADEEAMERRARRYDEMKAAARLLALAA